jgi:hypothetical protein
MVAVPPLMPVTKPLSTPTVATPVLLLLQVPPAAVLVNVKVLDLQTILPPDMAPGIGVTDNARVAAVPQPVL